MRKGIKIFLEKLKFVKNYQRFLRAKIKEKRKRIGHREHSELRGISFSFVFLTSKSLKASFITLFVCVHSSIKCNIFEADEIPYLY